MPKKILIVDDEPDVVEMVRARLESDNYEVVVAFNGEEGLKKVDSEKPDLIILDISMPHMDGYTFVREFKKTTNLNVSSIIILTAKEKMKDLFEIEGVGDYIVKPYEGEELLRKVRKHLESK